MEEVHKPWYRELNRYHWFVLLVAALGWLFDCLDQQLFVLARPAAVKELLQAMGVTENLDQAIKSYSGYATSIFLAGWATGGLFFGMLGDRIGRARTMLITILMYSLFTGLSAISRGFWDFAFYRFLTGLGVGGEFAVGVALVAEVMPNRARPYALATLQALSAVGNITAAGIFIGLGVAEENGLEYSPWRIMFVVGALPALLALVIRARLKEPEQWQKVSHEGAVAKQLGSYSELFTNPVFRKHAIVGLLLACSGVIGLWAVGFFTPDLQRFVQRKRVATEVIDEKLQAANLDESLTEQLKKMRVAEANPKAKDKPAPDEYADAKKLVEPVISGRLSRWQGYTSIMINAGAALGMFGFGAVSQRIGRKPTFAIALVAAFVSTATVFWTLEEMHQIFWMVPIMGFCQLSLFAGYAMYFPELFPTRLRSTGTSFCYNVGRFVAALGPVVQARLTAAFAGYEGDSYRYAGVTMSVVFLLGLFVLPLAPETKGKPLPE